VALLPSWVDVEYGILGVIRYRLDEVPALDAAEVRPKESRGVCACICVGHDRSIARAVHRGGHQSAAIA
jgi:hypothetical protein